MPYSPPYCMSEDAVCVLYWVMLTDSSSNLFSTGINVFSRVILFWWSLFTTNAERWM